MSELPNTETETALTDVELVQCLIMKDPSASTKQRVMTVLAHDPKFETLCFDVTKYFPVINGETIQTSNLLMVASYLMHNYRSQVCTFARDAVTNVLRANDLPISTTVKESVNAAAHENKFNPRTKYILDCYEKHGDSGVPLLETWLEKCGCYIDDDALKSLLPAISRKFIIQSVARVFHAGVQADMGLFLYEPLGDKLKSKFWRTLAVKSEWINESGVGDLKDEKKMGELLSPYWYVTFDENESISRVALGALKKMWTLSKDTYRTAWDIAVSDKLRQCVFGGTTNTLKLFLDEGGIARRFPVINVGKVDCEWLKANRDQLYAAAFHIYCQNLKDGVLAYDPEVENGYQPVTLYEDDYKPIDERIKGNCHWWFDEEHEPRLYAMLTQLSLRTLVTLSWQEELDFHLTRLVGEKIATRALKDLLGKFTRVTEDQIGRYLGSKGKLHTPFAKVNYNHIDANAGIAGGLPVQTIRLSGWLIGGDAPEDTKPSFLQKKVDANEKKDAEAMAEALATTPLVLTDEDVEGDFMTPREHAAAWAKSEWPRYRGVGDEFPTFTELTTASKSTGIAYGLLQNAMKAEKHLVRA